MKHIRFRLIQGLLMTLSVVVLFGFSPRAVSRPTAEDPALQAAEQYRAEKLARLRREQFVCGTAIDGSVENRFLAEKLRHEQNLRRLERLRRQGFQPRANALRADIGDIAIIEDDGQLILPANPFDLDRATVLFTPASEGGYQVSLTALDFDGDPGTKLTAFRGTSAPQDDGFEEVAFADGFAFPYFDQTYTTVFVGTNGYLTFVRGDTAPDVRLTFFLIRPRIAAFWSDLDPSRVQNVSTAGVFVKQLPDRVVVTYRNVPLFGSSLTNTFQITLMSTGQIVFSYVRMRALSGLVGISPGRASAENLIDFSQPPVETINDAIFELFRARAEVDTFAIPPVFYETHGDDFDFLYIWSDFDFVDPDVPGAFAFYLGLRNDAQGIGRGIFDNAGSVGSAGRLQGYLVMYDIVGQYPALPTDRVFGLDSSFSILAQEQGHRWLAFARYPGSDPTLLLGRDNAHWSFYFTIESTSAFSSPEEPRSSSMEGNVWRDNGDGSFSTPNNLLVDGYAELDQYLMGLRSPEEVRDSFVIVNPESGISRSTSARRGVTVRGTRQAVAIHDIVEANGPRIPTVETSQKEFRVAFILVTRQGTTPAQSTLDKLNLFRTEWEAYFFRATDGRARVDSRLSN